VGRVDKEEMAQWIQGVLFLLQEYARIGERITDAGGKGLAAYREVLAEGELPALLEKVRRMPIPKESKCKQVKKSFEKGIEFEMKGRGVSAKYAGETLSDSISKSGAAYWLSFSEVFIDSMIKDFRSLRKKYQI